MTRTCILAIAALSALAYGESGAPPDWTGYYMLARGRDAAGLNFINPDLNKTVIEHLQPWAKLKMQVRFIINHSGAAIPTLAGRIRDELRGPNAKQVAPNGAFFELRKLFFECAHATFPMPIAAARSFAPSTQLLFGTDFPIWPYETTVSLIPDLKLPADVQIALDRGNAERLFPKYA